MYTLHTVVMVDASIDSAGLPRYTSRDAPFSGLPCFLSRVDLAGTDETVAEEHRPPLQPVFGLYPGPGGNAVGACGSFAAVAIGPNKRRHKNFRSSSISTEQARSGACRSVPEFGEKPTHSHVSRNVIINIDERHRPFLSLIPVIRAAA